MPPLSSEDVGRRVVRVLDDSTGEPLALGILKTRTFDGTEISISVDREFGAPVDGPLGDGASYPHDVKPLEEELALAGEHPEYGIDVAAVRAALDEAKAAA